MPTMHLHTLAKTDPPPESSLAFPPNALIERINRQYAALTDKWAKMVNAPIPELPVVP